MAIGNPINLTSNVEGKNISVIATAGQTQFTVTGGYRINQISVFRNGVRLVDGRDFTALDGSIVTLLSAATVADVIEFQVFDDFRVSDALNVNSGGTVNGNVTVTGILSTTNLSIGSSISLDATSGIVTAVQFIGQMTGTASTATEAEGLTGVPDITVNNIVAAAATFSGVVTYEDVTNIDSLGIVTARTGVDITANGLVVNAGVSTFAADLSIADKIVHTGDANTAIRFPSNDTFTVETSGVQRLEVNSTGNVGLVGIATATGLVVVAGSGVYAGHTGIITAVTFDGALSGAATQVTVADESSDTTCFPLFATAATGDLAPKSGTNLTFNSSSGALTATSFVGAVTGDVTGSISGGTVAGSTGTFSGDVSIADKIVHTGDTNTALKFPAADTFTVETDGSERFRISSAGLVGIGTDDPDNFNVSADDLVIFGTGHQGITIRSGTAHDGSIMFNDTNDANQRGIIRYIHTDDAMAFHTSGGEALRITSSGLIGINENNPGHYIDMNIGTTNIGIKMTSTDAGAYIQFADNSTSSENSIGALGNDLQFNVNGGERLRVDSSGRVIIGATSARIVGTNRQFTIEGTDSPTSSASIFRNSNNTSGAVLALGKSRGTSDGSSTVLQNGDQAGAIFFYGADGTDAVSQAAAVSAEVDGTPGSNDMPGRLIFSTTADGASSVTERARIDSSGRLLIGTTSNFIRGQIQVIDGGGGEITIGRNDTTVTDGNDLGHLFFASNDENGTGVLAASIEAYGDNTHTSASAPTRLTISTTAVNATSPTERLRIGSRGEFLFSNGLICENGNVNSTARTGTQTVNLEDGMVHYFTSNSTGTWKPNFTMTTGFDINATISTGDVVSPTMIVAKGATTHYADSVQVDGSDVSIEWLGGAPSDGGGSGTFDIYSYTIIKTGSNTFKAFGSVSNYE